jgi:hypothetical protein
MESQSDLYNKINNELLNSNVQLDFKVLNYNSSISPEYQHQILSFINNYYISSKEKGTYKLVYSIDLFSFYLKGALCIEFYPKGRQDTIIGYIIGKPCILRTAGNINNNNNSHKELKSLEVNFLCLIPQLRNFGVSNYMKKILAKECLKKYNICIAHFTSSHNINLHYFCEKEFYHRVFNINLLKQINWFSNSDDLNIKEYQQFHNSFNTSSQKFYINYLSNLHYIDKNTAELIKILYNQYLSYCEKQFEIYDKIDLNTFIDSFKNKAFHHFIVKNENNEISAYISFFNLNIFHSISKKTCKTGYYYYFFFKEPESNPDVLEFVHQYIYSHSLFDLITFSDVFDFDMRLIKALKSSSKLKYYLLNHIFLNIKPNKNGLITI